MNQTELNWELQLQRAMQKANVSLNKSTAMTANITLWEIAAKHWQLFADLSKQQNLRWVSGWAEHQPPDYLINAVFEKDGQYLLVRTQVSQEKNTLPSQAIIYPAASRSERHTQDMFGIQFTHHPDKRRWLRHQAWEKKQYPLRKDFPLSGFREEITPADKEYPFIRAKGAGVYEIPVGPIHAGIIEPGHFRFQAVGETILNLETRLGYVHKGIEKLAETKTPEQLVRLAARISGDATVAHGWAACQAMESAANIIIPKKAAFIRGILLERERIANHLGDIGAICNDVGFTFAQMQFSRLRELWLRTQARYFNHRLLMDCIIPGGVNCALSTTDSLSLARELTQLKHELDEILPAMDLNSSLEDRLCGTGFLSTKTAADFGVVGYVGRASGQRFDVRQYAPYAPYNQLDFNPILEQQGDVASRVWVRVKEIFMSIKLLQQLLSDLPEGELKTPWNTPDEASEGLGIIESWRGEIVTYVRFAAGNKMARFYPRDPSILNWPALEKIVLNNIVPDFPVCNKSVNGSYSGQDL